MRGQGGEEKAETEVACEGGGLREGSREGLRQRGRRREAEVFGEVETPRLRVRG